MGPIELLDYVGLDTTKFILDGMFYMYRCTYVHVSACGSTPFGVQQCCLAFQHVFVLICIVACRLEQDGPSQPSLQAQRDAQQNGGGRQAGREVWRRLLLLQEKQIIETYR